MRIGSQNVDSTIVKPESTRSSNLIAKNITQNESEFVKTVERTNDVKNEKAPERASKEKLEEAVASINEFLEVNHKASKFVLHDGLDKYYVRLVDAETEEVIKEIPPERLLNAFYEMQKLAGMIVDEKI